MRGVNALNPISSVAALTGAYVLALHAWRKDPTADWRADHNRVRTDAYLSCRFGTALLSLRFDGNIRYLNVSFSPSLSQMGDGSS